ncbi:hypothetical protein [Catellatospora vulcania]|uniref:hypothetical protein n=1 Tax=Catellatospora vulcania TaxID=1460450 RepID=UPI0012D3CE95|nr:hypothetical protein [Catellatospora vulcania]
MADIERVVAYLPFVLAVLYLVLAAVAWRAMRRWGAIWMLLLLLPAAAFCSMTGSRTTDELVASWHAERGDGVAGRFVATEVNVNDSTPAAETWIGTFIAEDHDIRDGVRLDNPPPDMRPGTAVPARDTGATLAVYGDGPHGAFQDQLIMASIQALLWLAPGLWLLFAVLRRRRITPAHQLSGTGDDTGLDHPVPDFTDSDDDD